MFLDQLDDPMQRSEPDDMRRMVTTTPLIPKCIILPGCKSSSEWSVEL